MRPKSKRARVTTLAVMGVAALTLTTATGAAQTAPTTTPTTAPSSGPAADQVTVRTETFVDHHRPTPAVVKPRRPARKTRTLKTTIWAPAAPGSYPLIVFAHGCNGHGRDNEALLRAWAAAGFVVAAPDFPVSSLGTPDVACVTDVAQQPDDVSFVITSVLALDRAKGGLGGIVDRKHIGVAGRSLGAVTTLGVAFRSCCRDRRIDAAISFSGTPLLRGTDFRGIRTPLLLVHGDADTTIPISASTTVFTKAAGPRYLLTILGGSHSGYLEAGDAVTQAVLRTSLDFWAGYLDGDEAALARLAADAAIPGATTFQQAG